MLKRHAILVVLGTFLLGWPCVAEYQQSHAHAEHNQSAQAHEPTQPPKAVIEPSPASPHGDGKAGDDKQGPPQEPWKQFFVPEWVIVYITTIYVVITALMLIAIKRQGKYMKRQTDILEDSVTAAQTGANAAAAQIQMMKEKERARLSIEPLPLTAFSINTEFQRIDFSITNFGSTFATQVRVISTCSLGRKREDCLADDAISIDPQMTVPGDILSDHLEEGRRDVSWIKVLATDNPTRITVPLFWYPSAKDAERIYSTYINVKGRVDYDDIFGEHHFFRFRYSFHLLKVGACREWMQGAELPIESVAKWSGRQDQE